MRKIRAAVIGVGFIGAVHIEALRRLGNVDVVAVCVSEDSEKTGREQHVEQHFTDYREMIDTTKPDFVHICTPNFTHFEIAAYAIERGINVVLEKPMTVTVSEAEELVKLARQHKVIAAVNFHNRFYPATHYMRELIQRNELGRLISVNGSYVQDWLLRETDFSWRLITRESGQTRVVADIGSHWIDLVEHCTGLRVTEVLAEFQTVYPTRKQPQGSAATFEGPQGSGTYTDVPIDTEDIASLVFRFDNGATGSCFLSQMFAGAKNRIRVSLGGTESSVEWNLDDLNNLTVGHRDLPNQTVTKDWTIMGGESASLISVPSGHAEGFPDAFKQAFKQIYAGFAPAADAGAGAGVLPASPAESNAGAGAGAGAGVPPFYATFEDGLRSMIICEKIYESSQTHKFTHIGDTQ